MAQEAWEEYMRRQRLKTDAVAKVADADVAKKVAEAAAVTKTADAEAAAVAKTADAEAAAVAKAADAEAAAVAKAADAEAAKKKAEEVAVTTTANENVKGKKVRRWLALGSAGITTIALLYLWLDWLYYDSAIGLKWHIKRFLKKSNKYEDPRKDEDLLAKVLPVRLRASKIDLSDVYAKENEARVLATLDKIRRKQFPYMLVAPTGQGKSTLLRYFAYLLSANDRPTAYIGFRLPDDGKQSEVSAASESTKVTLPDVAPPATGDARSTAPQTNKPVLLTISEQLCQYLEIPCGRSAVSRIRKGQIFGVSLDGDVAQYRQLSDVMKMLFEVAREIYKKSNKKQKVLLIFDEVLDLTRESRAGSPSGLDIFKKLCVDVRICSTDQHNISIMFASSSSFLPLAVEGTVAAGCFWRRMEITVNQKDVSNYLKELNYTDKQIARIISLYDVRLRHIAEFDKQAPDLTAEQQSDDFKAQLDFLLKPVLSFLQEIIAREDAAERSSLIKAIDRLAANEPKVRLTDLPKDIQKADVINRVMYLEDDKTLRFQIPAFGEVWRTRREDIVKAGE